MARKSEKYMRAAREGLEGAKRILALSSHSAGTIAQDFPEMAHKTLALPGGVDTDLFRPDALDLRVLDHLNGGAGRGPEQRAALKEALAGSANTDELLEALRWVAGSYDARSHDRDAGDRLRAFIVDDSPSFLLLGPSTSLPRHASATPRCYGSLDGGNYHPVSLYKSPSGDRNEKCDRDGL